MTVTMETEQTITNISLTITNRTRFLKVTLIELSYVF